MFPLTNLIHLSHLGLSELIQKLVEIFAEASHNPDQSVPVVSIYMSSGQAIQGYVVSAKIDNVGKSTLQVANYTSGTEDSQDISFVAIDQIMGLTVHQSENVLDFLSDGMLQLPLPSPPGIDSLKRRLESYAQEFSAASGAVFSHELQVGDEAQAAELESLHYCILDWARVMRRLIARDSSLRALQDRKMKFDFGIGEAPSIRVNADQVLIQISSSDSGAQRPSRESMHNHLVEIL